MVPISSYAAKALKPAPQIYKVLLERYGLMPDECVFINDCLQNIEGAARVGIHGIHFKNITQVKKVLKNKNYFQ